MPTSLPAQRAGEQAQRLAQETASAQRSISLDTVLAHAGVVVDETLLHRNAPLSPPLHLATTYVRPADGNYRDQDARYTRMDNPTRTLFEQEMTRLELHDTHDNDMNPAAREDPPNYSMAFASGMMAVSAIVLAHSAPLLVLLPQDLYHGVPSVLEDVFARFQVQIRRVDMQHLEIELQEEPLPSDKDIILWIETPSNPQAQVIDIDQTCRFLPTLTGSHRRVTTVVDTTLAPLQRPLQFGADLSLHSVTKCIGGHSDVLCGVVTVHPSQAHDLVPRLRNVQVATGGVAAPLDCWLALRGLRTLAVRYERQCRTAQRLAEFLEALDHVAQVHYPGLESHSQRVVARRQMKGQYGGVLSMELRSEEQAMAFAGALETLLRATSLGGTESLIEHRASIEPEGRVVSPVGLLRISVGLEDAEDLINDVQRALSIMNQVCRDAD